MGICCPYSKFHSQSSTSLSIKNKIPFEVLFHKSVDYSPFRVFGCRVFFFIPKEHRAKFDKNSHPGIFLGYSNNITAYKIFDLTNNKIVNSRTVEFLENEAGNTKYFQFSPDSEFREDGFKFYPSSQNIKNSSQLKNNIKHKNNIRNYFNNSINNKYPINNLNNINKIQNNYTSSENQNELNNINSNSKKRKIKNSSYILPKKKRIENEKLNNTTSIIEPYNYKDIFKTQDKVEWLSAIKEELNNMKSLNVYTTIKSVPQNCNLISSRWVFKYKRDPQGKVIKRKARLVAKGYTQEYGIDYKKTFAPTLKQDTIRIITVLAVQRNFNIIQIDINSAYLNAPLSEDIYMRAPEGDPSYGKYFWKLNKALYGLKQAGKEWNDKLNEELIKIGFNRLKSEPCVYTKLNKSKEIICILSVYVDDILIA